MATPAKPELLLWWVYKVKVLAPEILPEKLKQLKEWKSSTGEKKDGSNCTRTAGCVLMSSCHDFQPQRLHVV